MAEVQGIFEQAVLIAVATSDRDASGATILAAVRQRLKRTIQSGAVHSTLQRLEKKGLVIGREVSRPDGGGRPRRYFAVRKEGFLALRRAKDEIQRVWGDFVIPEPG